MSTSMPITCGHTAASAHKLCNSEHLPLLIPRILMSINYKHVRTFCEHSLASVCKQYAIPTHNATIQCIQAIIREENASHVELLAIFFLLFNIDTELKNRMMVSDTEQQRGKIENFSMNLRKYLVTEFLSADKSNAAHFVTQCSDAWTVA